MKATQRLPEHTGHYTLKFLALLAVCLLVYKSIEECNGICCAIAMQNRVDYLLILTIAYMAHIVLRLKMHHRKDAFRYAWMLRGLLILLLLVPHFFHQEKIQLTGEVGFLTADAILPLLLLIAIEVLMEIYMWIIDKRPPRSRRAKIIRSATQA